MKFRGRRQIRNEGRGIINENEERGKEEGSLGMKKNVNKPNERELRKKEE